MWHLKTRLGTFWVIEKTLSSTQHQYYLGVDDNELASYTDANQAAQDVYNQATGYFQWDCQSRIKVPTDLADWVEGDPENW